MKITIEKSQTKETEKAFKLTARIRNNYGSEFKWSFWTPKSQTKVEGLTADIPEWLLGKVAKECANYYNITLVWNNNSEAYKNFVN